MMILRTSTSRRNVLVAVAVLVAVTACLAGCGTVPDRSAAARRTSARITAANRRTDARITVAPAGSSAEATALAMRLLAELVLPAGAARLRQQAVPAALRHPGFTGAGEDVDLYRYYRLPMTMAAAESFLQAHPPAGLTFDTTGTVGLGNDYLAGSPRSLPPGIGAVMLQYTMATVPGGGSLLSADVQVMFYPPRSAAEYLDPARFRSVTVSAARWDSTVPAIRRTITSRREIAMLAGLVNWLPVMPPGSGPIGCPFIGGNMLFYQLEFTPVSGTGPVVVVKPDGCLSDLVSVGGVRQPPLQDGDTVTNAAARLLKPGS
jgi:hypothetical protein